MAKNGVTEPTLPLSLTGKQQQFVEALLASSNITIAAKSAGVSLRTAQRWYTEPAIKDACRAGRAAMFDAALQSLCDAVGKAVDTLVIHMGDSETPAPTRVRAAQIVLERAIDVHKMADLERKVEELQQLVQEYGLHKRG